MDYWMFFGTVFLGSSKWESTPEMAPVLSQGVWASVPGFLASCSVDGYVAPGVSGLEPLFGLITILVLDKMFRQFVWPTHSRSRK